MINYTSTAYNMFFTTLLSTLHLSIILCCEGSYD